MRGPLWNSRKILIEGSSRETIFHKVCEKQLTMLAPHHNESDLTRTKCWEGCESHIKLSTVPQQEPSKAHKVTRGLGELYEKTPQQKDSALTRTKWERLHVRYQNEHRAGTSRVIQHAQRQMCEHIFQCKFILHTHTHQKKLNLMKMRKRMFYLGIRTLAPATENYHHAPNPKATVITSQNERFQPFIQIIIGVCKKMLKQNVPATKWGHPQPPLSSTHACQHFSNMHEVLRLLHGWKSFESLALVTQNDVPDLKIPATKKDPLVL